MNNETLLYIIKELSQYLQVRQKNILALINAVDDLQDALKNQPRTLKLNIIEATEGMHRVPYNKEIANIQLSGIMQKGNPRSNVPARPFIDDFKQYLKGVKFHVKHNKNLNVFIADYEDKINALFQRWIKEEAVLEPLNPRYLKSHQRISDKPLLRTGTLAGSIFLKVVVVKE